jgi:hypothetical protein
MLKQLGFMIPQPGKENYDSNKPFRRIIKHSFDNRNPSLIRYPINQNINSCKIAITPDRKTKSSYELLSYLNNQNHNY